MRTLARQTDKRPKKKRQIDELISKYRLMLNNDNKVLIEVIEDLKQISKPTAEL